MSKKMLTILFVMVTFLMAAPVQARPGKGKGKGHLKQMMKDLNLSKEQKEKMKEIKKNKPDMKTARANVKNLREQMKAALKTDTSDADLIKIHGEIQTARSKMATDRFNHMLKVRAILTPEQRIKFHEMKDARRGRRHGPDDED